MSGKKANTCSWPFYSKFGWTFCSDYFSSCIPFSSPQTGHLWCCINITLCGKIPSHCRCLKPEAGWVIHLCTRPTALFSMIMNEWMWFVQGMCTITGKYCKPFKSLSTGIDPPVFTQTVFPPLPCLNTTLFAVQVYRRQSEEREKGKRRLLVLVWWEAGLRWR